MSTRLTPGWDALVRHAPELARQQNAHAEGLRAAALAEGVRNLLTPEAVAEHVGVPQGDVEAAVQHRPSSPSAPLAELLTIVMPRMAEAVPLEDDWMALPVDQRAERAARAARAWWTQAVTCRHLARQLEKVSDAMYQRDLLQEETEPDVVELAESWPAVPGVTGFNADSAGLARDLSEALHGRATQARHQAGIWEARAEYPATGGRPPVE